MISKISKYQKKNQVRFAWEKNIEYANFAHIIKIDAIKKWSHVILFNSNLL